MRRADGHAIEIITTSDAAGNRGTPVELRRYTEQPQHAGPANFQNMSNIDQNSGTGESMVAASLTINNIDHWESDMTERDLFEKGLAVRKEVLGADYVEKSIAGADEFTRTMAEWSTAYCWGALWTRPGFDRRSRSIVNLAMISALNRPHELKLHVKAALKNGLTRDEVKEIFLQVAVYAGVPAGIDSFRIAREAFKEVDGG
jgi:4-carboxymuconolactone decarboxylase